MEGLALKVIILEISVLFDSEMLLLVVGQVRFNKAPRLQLKITCLLVTGGRNAAKEEQLMYLFTAHPNKRDSLCQVLIKKTKEDSQYVNMYRHRHSNTELMIKCYLPHYVKRTRDLPFALRPMPCLLCVCRQPVQRGTGGLCQQQRPLLNRGAVTECIYNMKWWLK